MCISSTELARYKYMHAAEKSWENVQIYTKIVICIVNITEACNVSKNQQAIVFDARPQSVELFECA